MLEADCVPSPTAITFPFRGIWPALSFGHVLGELVMRMSPMELAPTVMTREIASWAPIPWPVMVPLTVAGLELLPPPQAAQASNAAASIPLRMASPLGPSHEGRTAMRPLRACRGHFRSGRVQPGEPRALLPEPAGDRFVSREPRRLG